MVEEDTLTKEQVRKILIDNWKNTLDADVDFVEKMVDKVLSVSLKLSKKHSMDGPNRNKIDPNVLSMVFETTQTYWHWFLWNQTPRVVPIPPQKKIKILETDE